MSAPHETLLDRLEELVSYCATVDASQAATLRQTEAEYRAELLLHAVLTVIDGSADAVTVHGDVHLQELLAERQHERRKLANKRGAVANKLGGSVVLDHPVPVREGVFGAQCPTCNGWLRHALRRMVGRQIIADCLCGQQVIVRTLLIQPTVEDPSELAVDLAFGEDDEGK